MRRARADCGRRLAGLLALGLLLAGCAGLPRPPAEDAEARLALLEEVWQVIDKRHVDPPPPDWPLARERHRQAVLEAPAEPDPEALWQALDRVAGERRDAHTRVEGPRDVRRRVADRGPTLGFTLARIEDQWVAERVQAGSAAAAAGLRPGMRLLRWQGREVEAEWAERLARSRQSSTPQARALTALRQWLDGPPGSRVLLHWQGLEGQVLPMELERTEQELPPRWSFEPRASGVAVLRWNRFDTRIEGALAETLRHLPPISGLVLDLRGNGGGNFEMTRRLLELLLPENQPVQLTRLRGSQKQELHRAGGPGAYAGPLRVLVDAGSASGAEMLAGALQHAGRARVLGETSCGCLLGIQRYLGLPGGGRLAVSERALTLPDGRRLEGQGLQPDRLIVRSLAALRAGRDEVLEAAEQELLARSE